jgi:hypothetical protein
MRTASTAHPSKARPGARLGYYSALISEAYRDDHMEQNRNIILKHPFQHVSGVA